MPQVGAAIATFASSVAATGAGLLGASAATGFAISAAVYAGMYYAANTFLLNKGLALLQKRGKSGETRGLEVSYTDSTADARVIYGEVRVGGINMIPPVADGDDGDFQHQILVLAVHEIDSFVEHYFDQDTLPTPAAISGAMGDGAISSGKYDGSAWVRGYRGTMTQNVDFRLNAAFPSQWLSTARGRGWAYIAYTYKHGKGKVFQGMPQPTAKIRGARVYDPRLDSTNGGSGSHRYTDSTTWEYSNNPALCWANYRIASYGFKNNPATDINWATVAASADICDALVEDKDGGTQARYTCNGMLINSKESLQSNEHAIIDSMLGHRRTIAGRLEILAGAWDAPSWTIAKSDWISIENITTVSGPEDGRVNAAHCFYVDPDRNWQRVECYPRRNTTYLSDDGGYLGEAEMEQPLCTNESEAQRKAEFMLRASRNGISLVGTLPPRFQKMKTFDTVAMTFEELLWVSKTFRIAAMAFNMDGSVKVVLVEEQEADWEDLEEADYGALSDASIPAVNPTKPTAPQNLTIRTTSGTIELAWEEPNVVPLGTRYQLIASPNSGDASVGSIMWSGDALRAPLPFFDTNSGTWWYVRAYAGSYFSAYSPNTYGVFGVAGYAASLTGAKIIPDGQFRSQSTITSYWQVSLPVSASPTGGMTDGTGKLISVGTTSYGGFPSWVRNAGALRDPTGYGYGPPAVLAQCHAGQWLNWTVAARRTTGLAGSMGGQAGLFVVHNLRQYTGGLAQLDVGSTFLRLDDKTVDVWQFFTGSVQVPSSLWEFVLPRLDFGAYAQSSGTIEVGRFDVAVL